jgi:hypothetical protein
MVSRQRRHPSRSPPDRFQGRFRRLPRMEQSDLAASRRLLCAGRKPPRRGAAEQRDERASPHGGPFSTGLAAARYHTVAPERRCASQQKLRADVADGSIARRIQVEHMFVLRQLGRAGTSDFTIARSAHRRRRQQEQGDGLRGEHPAPHNRRGRSASSSNLRIRFRRAPEIEAPQDVIFMPSQVQIIV